jgi:hypothetical protein
MSDDAPPLAVQAQIRSPGYTSRDDHSPVGPILTRGRSRVVTCSIASSTFGKERGRFAERRARPYFTAKIS